MSEFPKVCVRKSTAAKALSVRRRISTGGTLQPGGCASRALCGPVHLPARSSLLVIVETTAPVELPDRGSLGHHALFDKGVLVAPELPPQGSDDRQDEWEVRIKRAGEYTRVIYPFSPMDVVSWKGDLWVAKLNVRDIRP